MGRRKGVRGELEIAHRLQDWWRRTEPSATFIRTPLSGGWAYSSGAAAHFRAAGDIMTTGLQFPFCVEVKWQEGWSVDQLLDSLPSPAWGWWDQCQAAAVKQGEVPCMFMRKNRIRNGPGFPWLVWVPETYWQERKLALPDIRFDQAKLLHRGVVTDAHPVVYLIDRFLEMSPERMRKDGQESTARTRATPARIAGTAKAREAKEKKHA